jgi:hypothetical protein
VFEVGEVIGVQKGRFDLLLDFLATNKDSTGQPAIIMFHHPKNTPEVEAKEYGRDEFPHCRHLGDGESSRLRGGQAHNLTFTGPANRNYEPN